MDAVNVFGVFSNDPALFLHPPAPIAHQPLQRLTRSVFIAQSPSCKRRAFRVGCTHPCQKYRLSLHGGFVRAFMRSFCAELFVN